MPTRKRKSRKQRGSRYCGWGQVGQHRKSGGRGGVGKAGGRDHFLLRTLKYEPNRYRNKGFNPPSALKPEYETINVGELEHLLLTLAVKGDIIDLESMGIDKLLGRGNINKPLKIKVKKFSIKANEKIKQSGGTILE
jgi:large subunit ribosomal protein L15